jgi:hypothetical protein
MIDAGLYTLLSGDSALTALATGGIFAVAAPDDASKYPCVAYSFVGGSAEPTMNTSGVYRQRIELNGLAFDRPTAAAIRAAIIKALDGWRQLLGDGTNVITAEVLNPGTDFISEQRIFRCLVEFYVHYTLPN